MGEGKSVKQILFITGQLMLGFYAIKHPSSVELLNSSCAEHVKMTYEVIFNEKETRGEFTGSNFTKLCL